MLQLPTQKASGSECKSVKFAGDGDENQTDAYDYKLSQKPILKQRKERPISA